MRHLSDNFTPGDRVELTLTVEAEIVVNEAIDEGRMMTVRVDTLKHRANGKPVLWSQGADDGLELVVEVGARQRLLAVGVSARQREVIKARIAGLSQAEAALLLREIANGEEPNKQSELTTDIKTHQ